MAKFDKNTRIMLTGASGQLGLSLKKALDNSGEADLHFFDRQNLDVTDQQSVLKVVSRVMPHWIINCAAFTGVDKAEENEDRAFLVNAGGAENLAKAAEALGACLVHFSTDYVFSGRTNRPYTEEDNAVPHSVYGSSKLAGEANALKFCKRSVVFRTSWLYSNQGHNFYNTMLRLGSERDFLNVVYDQIGTPTYAGHLATAVVRVISGIQKDPQEDYFGLFHLTNEGVGSWYDFSTAIMRIHQLKCPVYAIETNEYPTPASRPPYSLLSKKKFRATFGFSLPHWLEGVHACAKSK